MNSDIAVERKRTISLLVFSPGHTIQSLLINLLRLSMGHNSALDMSKSLPIFHPRVDSLGTASPGQSDFG